MITASTIERIERAREQALPGREAACVSEAWRAITRTIRTERRVRDHRRRAISVRLPLRR